MTDEALAPDPGSAEVHGRQANLEVHQGLYSTSINLNTLQAKHHANIKIFS